MTRTIEPAATPAAEPEVVPARGILVATDGTPDADGAVRVGHALALRDNVPADVFSVVEPPALVDVDGAPIPDIDQLVTIAHESRGAALLSQRDRTHPGLHDWPFTVAAGPRVETIIKRAAETEASLILLGLGAHGVAARLSQRETALRVIRSAGKPVLAVPSVGWGVPHSALAAIDFTASSEHAARAAMDLLGVEGTLYLAHVLPRVPIPQGDSRTWDEITSSAVSPRLEAVARRLGPPAGVRVEFVLLHGDPAHELLAFAEQTNIDLVAAGTHGRSALGRLVLGSVSTKLIRTASCWVLVAPPHPDLDSAEASLADGGLPPEPPNVWW
jgi:nucleotide-binding universal stress UspA family protein